jgi:hypothetical protein
MTRKWQMLGATLNASTSAPSCPAAQSAVQSKAPEAIRSLPATGHRLGLGSGST